ncbi:MAG: long-chain fatty acid--CoA ligase [Bacteroidales bacterium]|nr:long-chain fatty acid--CoA ligase [Bacteroidales bacterium]
MLEIRRVFDLLDQYKGKYASKKNAFGFKSHNVWNTYSSSDYINYVNEISLGLIELGVQKGDKIATIMVNCPEWNFIDMGLMQIGAIQVPIYPTISTSNFKYIFNDVEVKFVFVSNNEIFQKIKPIIPEIVSIKEVYSIEKLIDVKNWQEVLNLGKESNIKDLKNIKSSILPDEIATIIYTSGTTGIPKGVMLSHFNLISNIMACSEISPFKSSHRAFSFLPLCHIYERMLNYLYQNFGMSIYYSDNFENIGENIREVKPHTFCAVPRVLEKVCAKIERKGDSLSGIKRKIFQWAVSISDEYKVNKNNGFVFGLKREFADFFVFRKWRKSLGGNLIMIVSGGAPLQQRISRLFWTARIPVMTGYGLTETSPVIAVSNFGKDGIKFGTVGPLLKDVEVKIAEDGEVLVKSPGLMQGYYNRPDRTKEVIDKDGWFYTGDIGCIEDGRYLKITDRKKEMFKTSGGKYVAPQVIENIVKESPFIEKIIVIGEKRRFTSALILPNFEHLEAWCKIKNIDFTTNKAIIKNKLIIDRIDREIKEINFKLNKVEQIKKFSLIADDWTVETGELSPTLKLRRKFIQEKYKDTINGIYRFKN